MMITAEVIKEIYTAKYVYVNQVYIASYQKVMPNSECSYVGGMYVDRWVFYF